MIVDQTMTLPYIKVNIVRLAINKIKQNSIDKVEMINLSNSNSNLENLATYKYFVF